MNAFGYLSAFFFFLNVSIATPAVVDMGSDSLANFLATEMLPGSG